MSELYLIIAVCSAFVCMCLFCRVCDWLTDKLSSNSIKAVKVKENNKDV